MASVTKFCTCGETEPHTIAKRRTADGITVMLWSDGAVTGAFGGRFPGLPVRRPRTVEGANKARRVGRLFLGEVEIYDEAELGELYAAAERASRADGLPGTVRRLFAERRDRPAPITLAWVVTETDRDGRPTERQARLPRLRWPGYHVIDFCGGPGSAQGRYVLFHEDHSSPYGVRLSQPSLRRGCAFRRLADLWTHLREIGIGVRG